MRLQERVAIVIGGASGIGQGIAERFVREGAVVIIADIDESRLGIVGEELKELGNQGYAAKCDMTDPEQVQTLVDKAAAEYGSVDILVCSGGSSWITHFLDISVEEWDKVIRMHLNSAFYASKAAAPYMIKQNYGRIIYISSGNALRGRPYHVHYTAAKGGVVALARALGSELGPYGITVNTLAPGLTITPMSKGQMTPEIMEKAAKGIPTKKLGVPADLAAAAVLFASEEGGQINCHTLAIDGGETDAEAARD